MYQNQKTLSHFFANKNPIRNPNQALFLPAGAENHFPIPNQNIDLFYKRSNQDQDESFSTFFNQFEPQIPKFPSADTSIQSESYFNYDVEKME